MLWIIKGRQMIKKLAILLLLLVVGTSISCTYHQPTVQERAITAAAISSCQGCCKQVLAHCQDHCVNNDRCCRSKGCLATIKSYHQYKKEQCMQGYGVVRRLNSFRDPLQCRKTTCNCMADYRVCMQSCAKEVHG